MLYIGEVEAMFTASRGFWRGLSRSLFLFLSFPSLQVANAAQQPKKNKKTTDFPRYDVVFNLALSLTALSAETSRGSHFDTDCPPVERIITSPVNLTIISSSCSQLPVSQEISLLPPSSSSVHIDRNISFDPSTRSLHTGRMFV